MLKLELQSLDGLDENLHQFYKEDSGVFRLQVDGIEDTGELKRAYERVKEKHTETKNELSDMKSKFEQSESKLHEALASNEGGSDKLEALRTSYEEKFTRLQTEKDEAVGGKDKFIQKMLKDNKAMEMAGEMAVEGAAKVLMPHINARLSVEQNGDEYKTVVLDASGQPSAATLEDLKNEFANDAAFAHVIVGSKASGGDAGQGGKGGDASNIDFATASTKEKVAAIKAKRGD